ncbi:MAG: phospholipase D family protein [Thiothrix sp.]|nr:MAG: phospholipase D family protein [Thiothrix sp.]
MLPVALKHALVLVLLSLSAIACAQLPPNINRTPSVAWSQPEKTSLGRLVASQARHHPKLSGFSLLAGGRQAFNDRLAMIELAEKSLDLQYYIWEEDTTGLILAERLLKAADRGVRVRILLDDNNMANRDRGIALLDAHLHIEIRMANPFAQRHQRLIGFITDFDRLNHRMHNKSMAADGAIAIVGGRNIGDNYFEVDEKANFRDMDLFVAGPLVKEVSHSFDNLWNGSWSYPISTLTKHYFSAQDLAAVRSRLSAFTQKNAYPHALEKNPHSIKQQFQQEIKNLIWAKGWVFDNDPVTLVSLKKGEISQVYNRKLASLKKEILIESAYFVVRKQGIKKAQGLIAKGVKIRVLTNSLASNDVLAAHAGYAKTREHLIKAGVEIYELRPDVQGSLLDKLLAEGESKSSLHTKSFAFDQNSVFIGSYNLDPRSANINTEIGIYVESAELAHRLVDFMNRGVNPEVSWRVVLNAQGKLRWLGNEQGKLKEYEIEPMTTLWQRLTVGVLRLLPIEDQL